jgi:branched-chain amino acid transport system substrate-binding protein
MKGAKECGLNVVAEANYVQDEKDFSSMLLKLQAAKPDCVVIFDQGAVPQIVNQIAQMNWKVQVCALGPGTSQQILDLCGQNANGLITSTPFFFDETNEKQTAWKKTFTEKAGFEPTVHPVVAYDCVYLIAKAIEMIGNGEVTRDAIRDNLQNAQITGLAGDIKFSENRDIARNYLICQADNGKFVIKEGYDYSAN